MKILLGIFLSYLLGSIPIAFLFARIYRGIDIRKHGSGNVGATNVFRVLGKWPGIFVLLCDIAKGLIATTLLCEMLDLPHIFQRIMLGLSVVSGHNWTIFLKFKGGKGIATSLGVLIGFAIEYSFLRIVLAICTLIWGLTFLLSGYVSLASMVSACFLPLVMVLTNQAIELIILGVIFCIFVMLRHQGNIKRLLSGTESRIFTPFKGKKKYLF